MDRNVRFLGLVGLVGVGLLIAAAAVWPNGGTAGAQTAVMKVVPASRTVDVGDGKFTVEMMVEDVSNLAAFEFTLTFDPSVLRLVKVDSGPFLGSTGRVVQCPAPIHESPAPSAPSEDALRFGCVTSGEGMPGASGSGLLGTVTFAPRKAGTSRLRLGLAQDHFFLTDPLGEDLTVSPQGGSVEVVGSGPPATPEPDEPTAIPTAHKKTTTTTPTPRDSWWLTPEPGEISLARPLDGSYAAGADTGGSGASGASGGSGAGGGAQGTAGGSPRAGTGPPEEEAVLWPTLAAVLLAAGGATSLSFAFYLRRAVSRRRT
jgi:hypothetical protein